MRLGDLDELKKQFDNIPVFIGLTGGCVQKMIDDMPVVEAALVVHAKWNTWGNEPLWQECSACHYRIQYSYSKDCNYCPHCGAKMDGE